MRAGLLPLLLTDPHATAGAAHVVVYRYRDAQGVEHFVDHPDRAAIAAAGGSAPEPLDLTTVPLNPETARGMEKAAASAGAAARESAKHTAQPSTESKPAPPPPEVRVTAIWALALTISFLVLVLLRRLTRRGAPSLAAAFGTLRFAVGALALMACTALLYQLRDHSAWIADHVPALQALARARATTEKVQRQQQQLEREIDKSLRGE